MQLRRARAGKSVTIKPSSSPAAVGDTALGRGATAAGGAKSTAAAAAAGRHRASPAATGRGDASGASAGKTTRTPPAGKAYAPAGSVRARAT